MEEIFQKHELPKGRLISASKSGYRKNYPDNLVLFNANIFIKQKKTFSKNPANQIWFGDLDITLDALKLREICDEIGEEMIVVSESKGRFGAEERPYKEIRKSADVIFTPNKDYYEVLETDGFEAIKLGNMYTVIGKPNGWKKIYKK